LLQEQHITLLLEGRVSLEHIIALLLEVEVSLEFYKGQII